MIEWEFTVKLHHIDKRMDIITTGKTFADALAFAVSSMVDAGKPWPKNAVGEIYLKKPLEWISPETRPLMTFMPPLQVDPEAI
jgi:hypothetical protein